MKRETRNPKRQGELAELVFLYVATRLGFIVSKPWGDSAPYDFIVDAFGHLTRVQVRSVSVACRADAEGALYHVTCGTGAAKRPLTPRDADLLAAYIFPEDAWYLVPISTFSPVKSIYFRRGSRRKFEPYRNAWSVFTQDVHGLQAPAGRAK